MKRAAALRKLSDDHHQGLVQVQRLTKVAYYGRGGRTARGDRQDLSGVLAERDQRPLS